MVRDGHAVEPLTIALDERSARRTTYFYVLFNAVRALYVLETTFYDGFESILANVTNTDDPSDRLPARPARCMWFALPGGTFPSITPGRVFLAPQTHMKDRVLEIFSEF